MSSRPSWIMILIIIAVLVSFLLADLLPLLGGGY